MHTRSFVASALVALALIVTSRVSAYADNQTTDRTGIINSEFIFETAPFAECHASTIAETNGQLLAAWFGGTREKNPDVGIWSSRKIDGRWTAPVEVANGIQTPEKRFPCWNPVLFQPKEGPLMLFYKVGPDPESWWGMLATSQDHGKTWLKPERACPTASSALSRTSRFNWRMAASLPARARKNMVGECISNERPTMAKTGIADAACK